MSEENHKEFDWDALEEKALKAFDFAIQRAQSGWEKERGGAHTGIGTILQGIADIRAQRLAEELAANTGRPIAKKPDTAQNPGANK